MQRGEYFPRSRAPPSPFPRRNDFSSPNVRLSGIANYGRPTNFSPRPQRNFRNHDNGWKNSPSNYVRNSSPYYSPNNSGIYSKQQQFTHGTTPSPNSASYNSPKSGSYSSPNFATPNSPQNSSPMTVSSGSDFLSFNVSNNSSGQSYGTANSSRPFIGGESPAFRGWSSPRNPSYRGRNSGSDWKSCNESFNQRGFKRNGNFSHRGGFNRNSAHIREYVSASCCEDPWKVLETQKGPMDH